MFNIFSQILEIDSNPQLAGTIAIVMMVAIIIFCTAWLILKKVLLKRRYKADEEYVKEYKEKLKLQEKARQEEQKKPETIGEDF